VWKKADHFLLIWILLNWIHFHPHLDEKESPGGWRRVGDMLEFVLQMQFDSLFDHFPLEKPKYLTVFLIADEAVVVISRNVKHRVKKIFFAWLY
jgi:hypothetical protein